MIQLFAIGVTLLVAALTPLLGLAELRPCEQLDLFLRGQKVHNPDGTEKVFFDKNAPHFNFVGDSIELLEPWAKQQVYAHATPFLEQKGDLCVCKITGLEFDLAGELEEAVFCSYQTLIQPKCKNNPNTLIQGERCYCKRTRSPINDRVMPDGFKRYFSNANGGFVLRNALDLFDKEVTKCDVESHILTPYQMNENGQCFRPNETVPIPPDQWNMLNHLTHSFLKTQGFFADGTQFIDEVQRYYGTMKGETKDPSDGAKTVKIVDEKVGTRGGKIFSVVQRSRDSNWSDVRDRPGQQGSLENPLRSLGNTLGPFFGFKVIKPSPKAEEEKREIKSSYIKKEDLPYVTKIEVPDLTEINNAISALNEKGPRETPIIPIRFFSAPEGTIDDHQYLHTFNRDSSVPIAEIGPDQTFYFHDLNYHVAGYILIPNEILKIGRDQTSYLLKFEEFMKTQHPDLYSRPEVKYLWNALYSKKVYELDRGSGDHLFFPRALRLFVGFKMKPDRIEVTSPSGYIASSLHDFLDNRYALQQSKKEIETAWYAFQVSLSKDPLFNTAVKIPMDDDLLALTLAHRERLKERVATSVSTLAAEGTTASTPPAAADAETGIAPASSSSISSPPNR